MDVQRRHAVARLIADEYEEFEDFAEDALEFLGFSMTTIQRDIAKFMQHGARLRMVMAQRGEAKSTLAAIYAVWRIIQHPPTIVLIVSGGEKQASEVATLVIRMITTWDMLDYLRPDKSAGDRSSVEAFDVHWALKGINKSPSVACVGITANLPGKRADLLIPDDVETNKNGLTVTQRELLRHLDARGVAASARAVAVALWTHADPFGRCWPSQGTLARLAGVCERTVRTGLHALERAGVLLRDVPRLAERRRVKRTTAYRFTFGSWRSVGASTERAVARPASPTGHQGSRDESADAVVSEAPAAGVEVVGLEPGDVVDHQGADTADTREAIATEHVDAPLAPEGPQVTAPPPPPATVAAPSPATVAARRPQGKNVPRLARPAAPSVARTAPPPTRAPSPRGPTVAALADVLARCSALAAPSRRPAALAAPSGGSGRGNDRPPPARAVEGPPRAAAG